MTSIKDTNGVAPVSLTISAAGGSVIDRTWGGYCLPMSGQTIFHIAAYIIAIMAVIACVYFSTFLIKRPIRLFD